MKYLDGLAIFLESFKCDKNCPYCIAKDNVKFVNKDENFDKLEETLERLQQSGYRFSKFILSGNGEPSLYPLETIKYITSCVLKYKDMFDVIRFYTSGNLFFDDEKFNYVNENFDQINIMINSFDHKKDMLITRYNKNIWETGNFKKAKFIKLDISLTDNLDTKHLIEDIMQITQKHKNIHKVKLKSLKYTDTEKTQQSKWIKEHNLDILQREKILNKLKTNFKQQTECMYIINDDCKLVMNPLNRKIFAKWLVIKNGKVFNYFEKPIRINNNNQYFLMLKPEAYLYLDQIEGFLIENQFKIANYYKIDDYKSFAKDMYSISNVNDQLFNNMLDVNIEVEKELFGNKSILLILEKKGKLSEDIYSLDKLKSKLRRDFSVSKRGVLFALINCDKLDYSPQIFTQGTPSVLDKNLNAQDMYKTKYVEGNYISFYLSYLHSPDRDIKHYYKQMNYIQNNSYVTEIQKSTWKKMKSLNSFYV